MLKKGILDNRNRRWVGELKTMLADSHVYFVTVGAAHLAGPGGVPALMRAAGYRVEGPIDMAPSNASPAPALRLSRDADATPPRSSLPGKTPSSQTAQAKPSRPSAHSGMASSSPQLARNGEPPSSPRLALGSKAPTQLSRDVKPASLHVTH